MVAIADGVRSGYKAGSGFHSDFIDDVGAYKAKLDGMGVLEKVGHCVGVAGGEIANILTGGFLAYRDMYGLPASVRRAGRMVDSGLEGDVESAEPPVLQPVNEYNSLGSDIEDWESLDDEEWEDVSIDADGNVVAYVGSKEDEEDPTNYVDSRQTGNPDVVDSSGRRRYFANGQGAAGRRKRDGDLEASVGSADVEERHDAHVGAYVEHNKHDAHVEAYKENSLADYLIANWNGGEGEHDVPVLEVDDGKSADDYWAEAFDEINAVRRRVLAVEKDNVELAYEQAHRINDSMNRNKRRDDRKYTKDEAEAYAVNDRIVREAEIKRRRMVQESGLAENLRKLGALKFSVAREHVDNGFMSTLGVPFVYNAHNDRLPKKERDLTPEEKKKLLSRAMVLD